MARMKGIKIGEQLYDKYNYCSKCVEWLIGKPVKCPYCHYFVRSRPKYNKNKYHHSQGVKRY